MVQNKALHEAPIRPARPLDTALFIRMGGGFFHAPAGMQPDPQSVVWNTVRPSNKCRTSSVGHLAHEAAIIGLSFGICPCAIFGAIIAININPLNREFVAVAAIQGPLFKLGVALPFGANRDATPTIILVASAAGFFASRAHHFPNIIKTRSSVAMLSKNAARDLGFITPAGRSLSVPQVIANDNSLCPTRAPATPQSAATLGVTGLFNNRPPPNYATAQINKSGVLCHAA